MFSACRALNVLRRQWSRTEILSVNFRQSRWMSAEAQLLCWLSLSIIGFMLLILVNTSHCIFLTSFLHYVFRIYIWRWNDFLALFVHVRFYDNRAWWVIFFIHFGSLFKYAVDCSGCSRALLCTTEEDGVLRLQQLTVDHDLSNNDELVRLSKLGLDAIGLQHRAKIGEHHYTRTLGDYSIKSGYKDLDYLR